MAAHPDRIVSGSIIIDAPAETVFAIVSAPDQHPRIDGSGSVRGTLTGPDRLSAKGDTFGMDMKLFRVPYRIRNKVVELEPDRLIAWRHFGAHRWRYELEPNGAGTRVTESWDASRYDPIGWQLVRRLGFPERNRHGIEQTLVRLRAAAESDAPAG